MAKEFFIPAPRGDAIPLLSEITATGTGTWVEITTLNCAFQANISDTLTANATIQVHVSTDKNHAETAGEITLTGPGDSDGFLISNAPWRWARGYVSSISGTAGSSVTLNMGI